MKLNELLSTDANSLIVAQHDALKDYTVEYLNKIANVIRSEAYSKARDFLAYSPSGDGYGCDNQYIDFSDTGLGDSHGCDLGMVLDKLIELKKMTGE